MPGVPQRFRFGAASVMSALLAPALSASTAVAQPAAAAGADLLGATVDRYCVTCHNDRLRTADLSLDGLDLAEVGHDAELWERVVAKLRTRAMPPVGRPRPDAETYDRATRSPSRRTARRWPTSAATGGTGS